MHQRLYTLPGDLPRIGHWIPVDAWIHAWAHAWVQNYFGARGGPATYFSCRFHTKSRCRGGVKAPWLVHMRHTVLLVRTISRTSPFMGIPVCTVIVVGRSPKMGGEGGEGDFWYFWFDCVTPECYSGRRKLTCPLHDDY